MIPQQITDVLATKDRAKIKELYRALANEEAPNKWATKDIAKRIKDLVEGASADGKGNLILPAKIPVLEIVGSIADAELPFEVPPPLALVKVEPGPAQGELTLTLQPVSDLGDLCGRCGLREKDIAHSYIDGCRFIAAIIDPPAKVEGHPVAASCRCHPGNLGPCPARSSLGKFKSDYFTPEQIEAIRIAARADIDKMLAEKPGKRAATGPRVKVSRQPKAPRERKPEPPAGEFLGAKRILAALKPGTILEHIYRDTAKPPCKVEVVTPPDLKGKGGSYRYKLNRYSSLREIAKLDSGQDFNILYFFNLAPWPKHKDREIKRASKEKGKAQ